MKSQERKERRSVGYSKSAKMTEEQQQQVCKGVAEVLDAAYPGHIWGVSMQHRMVTVKNLLLSNTMGFCFDIARVSIKGKEIIMFGGELLERFRQRRGWIDADKISSERRNIMGDVVHDD